MTKHEAPRSCGFLKAPVPNSCELLIVEAEESHIILQTPDIPLHCSLKLDE